MQPEVTRPQHPVALALTRATHDSELFFGKILVETTDGRVLRGWSAIWGWEPDALILAQEAEGEHTVVPFNQVRTVSRKGLHPVRVAALVVGILAAGAYIGARLLVGTLALEPGDGARLGVLVAAFASPVLVWLLQGMNWLTRSRVLYPSVDA